MEKLPKIINKDFGRRELEKMRKIVKGELKPSGVHEEKKVLPDPPEYKEEKTEKETSKPAKGGTWHDDYDNY